MREFYKQEDGFQVWDFPTLNNELHHAAVKVDETIYETNHLPEPVETVIIDEPVIPDGFHEIQEKITYLDDIGFKLNAIVSEIDTSLLNGMMHLMKNTVRKIILKELSSDSALFKDMIFAALEDIKKENDTCIVFVSMDDITLFDEHPMPSYIDVRIDPTLKHGDFLIKTKATELVAILENRLTTLFGF